MNTENKNILGENLKYLRTSRNITQKVIADLLNVNTQSYQKYEYGERVPDVYSLIVLSKYFTFDIESLMTVNLSELSPFTKFLNNLLYKTYNNDIRWSILDKELKSYFENHVVIRHDRNEYYEEEISDPNDFPIPLSNEVFVYYIIHNNGIIYFVSQTIYDDSYERSFGTYNHIFIKNGTDQSVSLLSDSLTKEETSLLDNLQKSIDNQLYTKPLMKRNEDFLLSFIGETTACDAINYLEFSNPDNITLPKEEGNYIFKDNDISEIDNRVTTDSSIEFFRNNQTSFGRVIRATNTKSTGLLLYSESGNIMRLNGCTSGYGGKGPHGTHTILTECGFNVPFSYIASHENFNIKFDENYKIISPISYD